ncbi:mechanosensitive ion channel domain-containing protein [Mangrovimonas aestuarii]|uniref:mechanosensitive ion channel domain-containing protein n=1 Tax=Mangrovimonas aestuarii TaxID=3018443 RepID=UPI0023789AF4|nr:mechanosensitive ion channel domain-containing protein [Mangrovimonas aestuarii]
MQDFFILHKKELIYSLILISVILITNLIIKGTIKRIGFKSNITEARVSLVARYVTFLLVAIGLLIEGFILGVKMEQISLIFSSVFAVIGIALFAIWSILSNITSGVIMFFSFPYKVGDKIMIHDKDYPIKAIIEDIRAFHLHLRTDDGDLITYPNNLILQKAVTLIQKDAMDEGADAI